MIVYRVDLRTDDFQNVGYLWCRTLREAREEVESYGFPKSVIERVEISVTAEGVLSALRKYAAHEEG